MKGKKEKSNLEKNLRKKKMNLISRTITGSLMVLLGLLLIILSVFKDFWILIYGIPLFIIGIFIFFNKKEDKIEEIKGHKNQKSK